MEEKKIAICAKQITKIYKLYDRPSDRMKEALGLSRKKLYKEHYALKGVDMSIYQGETVGIIGTNGSGKSTILKIITGVLNPTAGELTVNGRISALLELGAGFNMEYNGIENVYLNGTMMGFSEKEIDARLQDILDFADIGDYVYQPCKTYSSGMFVRLAFAVAINIEPEILIVDEALSVGDVFFQAKCYHKFDEFKKMGKTILFVSHDLSSIAKYCDRVILLNRGVKLSEGSPKEMIDAYKQEADIHRITASKVFHVPMDQVTDLQRRNAKAVNFGIVYGISSFGLSQDLSISRKEAAEYIDKYFETYPGIKAFLDRSVEQAKQTGYSVTMFGRRRPIPELSSSNFMQRSFGERVAMNAPIQGTAADIMKIAMVRVEKRLREEGLKSKMILQVHDELLIETAKDEVEQVRSILSYEMIHAAELAVTLEIDLNTGDSWYDAH